MQEEPAVRIRDLERRVNLLTGLVVIQAIFQGGILLYLAMAFLLSLPILAFSHRYLPSLARRFGRLVSWIKRPQAVRK